MLTPASAFAHHVGGVEDAMPADQWDFVDSVAHGASADGNTDMETAPGDEAGAETLAGEINWNVTGDANMNTP
jgi:hypothetical protein